MKKTMSRTIAKSLRRATLAIACSVLAVSAAYGQGGPCAVSQIRVRIGTAAQNPLVNSLDLEIHFTNGTIHTIQKVPDVNGTATWGISSQNVVTIPLNETVPVSEIKKIRLIDNVSGGEWDMSFLRARALGSGWNGRIAAWGTDPNPSPHRFTATYPAFGIDTIPNACDFVRRPVEGPVRVAPGTPVESRRLLTNERIVQMVRGGQPETRIISAIQANPGNFDVSLNKLLALHREGVSGHVLNAMVIAELRQHKGLSGAGGANVELSPQPYPPKSRVNAAGQANAELSPQPYPPKNGTLLPPSTQQTMLGTQANSAAGDGGKSALLPAVMMQQTSPGKIGQGQTMSATGNASNAKMVAPPQTVAPAGSPLTGGGTLTLNNGGSNPSGSKTVAPPQTVAPAGSPLTNGGTLQLSGGTTVAPSGSPLTDGGTLQLNGGTSQSGSKTVAPQQRVGPAEPPSERPAPTSAAQYQPPSGTPKGATAAIARGPLANTSLLVHNACLQDPSLRIVDVTGSGQPITFQAGRRYVIWGCSFGAANPNNAVYLSDGSSFTWFLHIRKGSWRAHSVVVEVQRLDQSGVQGFEKAYGGPQFNNLMLFVLGQNGNTKLNGVALSVQ